MEKFWFEYCRGYSLSPVARVKVRFPHICAEHVRKNTSTVTLEDKKIRVFASTAFIRKQLTQITYDQKLYLEFVFCVYVKLISLFIDLVIADYEKAKIFSLWDAY